MGTSKNFEGELVIENCLMSYFFDQWVMKEKGYVTVMISKKIEMWINLLSPGLVVNPHFVDVHVGHHHQAIQHRVEFWKKTGGACKIKKTILFTIYFSMSAFKA